MQALMQSPYAVVEHLSKGVVLAVVRRLGWVATIGLAVLPAGEILDLNPGTGVL